MQQSHINKYRISAFEGNEILDVAICPTNSILRRTLQCKTVYMDTSKV